MPVVWENLSDMKTYPRLTIRLSSSELNRVRVLARVRNRSEGQVVREALNLYFRAMTTETTR
jgi:predicted transcriptional regulator